MLFVLLLLGLPAQAVDKAPDITSLTYEIIRKGSSIGTHTVSFGPEESGTILVDITAKIRVKLVFITLFRLDHNAHEKWHNGRLVKMDSVTRENSKTKEVEVRVSDGQYIVNTIKGVIKAPDNIAPSSFTMPDFWISSGTKDFTLLDTLSGNLHESRLTYEGRRNHLMNDQAYDTRYYQIIDLKTGELSHEFWVDDAGYLVEANIMTHKGEKLTYRQIEPEDI